MKSNKIMIQLGYVLGASALLTAIGYFFASNWEKLNRLEKFIPIFVLILGFYGLIRLAISPSWKRVSK